MASDSGLNLEKDVEKLEELKRYVHVQSEGKLCLGRNPDGLLDIGGFGESLPFSFPNEFFQCIMLNDLMVTILKEYEIKWRWGWVTRFDRLERR